MAGEGQDGPFEEPANPRVFDKGFVKEPFEESEKAKGLAAFVDKKAARHIIYRGEEGAGARESFQRPCPLLLKRNLKMNKV